MKSPAKVNLRLEVIGRRPDGYHDIQSVMVPVGLWDVLRIARAGEDGIRVSCTKADIPIDERNLAYRAALLIVRAAEARDGFHIHIEKNIPVGSGLGGGSSNAATTLMGVNSLLGNRFSLRELMGMAAVLGADVPFFILGQPALATGTGEKLEEFPLPKLWFVLVYPGISVSTRWAYENLNLWLTNPRVHNNMPPFPQEFNELDGFFQNDLEEPTMREYPVLEWIKKRLRSAGAVVSLMSGSGSTVYGVFVSRKHAAEAYGHLKGEFGGGDWEVFLAHSIGHGIQKGGQQHGNHRCKGFSCE